MGRQFWAVHVGPVCSVSVLTKGRRRRLGSRGEGPAVTEAEIGILAGPATHAQLCSTVLNPMDCSPPGFSVLGILPGKSTGMDCHFLLQGIFPVVHLKNMFLISSLIFFAALGLCYCAWALSLQWAGLTAVAFLVAEHTLYERGLSRCGARA